MSRPYPPPEALAHLTELSLECTGSFVLFATDDYFAPADALLRPHAPEWREGAYTEARRSAPRCNGAAGTW